jgi:Concanavalin A-like lectin/glucanases superfamily
MWSRLVAARTWLIVTAALGTSGCKLDPISDPTVLDGGLDGRADGAADRAGGGGMPTTAPEGGLPGTDARDSGRDVVTITPDGPGSDGPPGSMDRPPPIDLAPDLAPDRMPDQTPPVETGLVAHWRFDEGTGTRAADATGNGNTATLHNGTAWERSGIARGPSDFAIRLDGENDYLSAVVGSMMPRIEAAKSIAYWYTADPEAPPPSGNQRTCIALLNPNMEVGIQVGVDRNRLAAWSWGQNEGFVITDAMPPPGAHHVAYTFDGTTHRLFLDGRLADSSTAQAQQGSASTFYVGTYQPTSELCAGQIDDLRVYSRALDAAELAQLAAR